MMSGMTIDVVENSARTLRTAALGSLVFDVLYVVHRLLHGLGPDDATPAGVSAFNVSDKSVIVNSRSSSLVISLLQFWLRGDCPESRQRSRASVDVPRP